MAKKVFEKIFTDNVDPEKYVEEQGLKTVNDEGALRAAVEKVLADNPQAVADYKGGKQKAFGALMGTVHAGHEREGRSGICDKDDKRTAGEAVEAARIQ